MAPKGSTAPRLGTTALIDHWPHVAIAFGHLVCCNSKIMEVKNGINSATKHFKRAPRNVRRELKK